MLMILLICGKKRPSDADTCGAERQCFIRIHAAFNAGAIKLHGRYCLVARVEGADRKSFFAVAESTHGTHGFRFWDRPVTMPEWGEPATNVYDMRLTAHEDGWIYGIFCVER